MTKSHFHFLLLSLSTFVLAATANAQSMDVLPKGDELVVLSQIIDMGGFIRAVVAIFIAWLLLRFVDRIVNDMGSSYAERRLTLQRFNAFFHFVVYFAAFAFIILFSFNFSDRVIAIIGGTVVVGLGFATRDLLASIVAGIMIIFDRPFQVGDRVRFGGEYGDILSIGLRSVKLQTLDDSTVTIPNNLFLTEVASSGNSGELDMQVMVDLYVGIDQDVQVARDIIREAAATSRYIYLPKPIVVLASQFPMESCIAMRLRLKAYVLDTKYEKDFETDVTLRAHDAFAKNKILSPAISNRNPT